ncbi:MAG: LysM peptidoglycan-binding domain-containing protein [Candidatus Peribacteria bacterium]|nr:LysM peptidoglycan-binding domain-containing protein [Candidatus Peribacteria bacterium]
MTRNQKVSKLKVFSTVIALVVLVVLIANADKLGSSSEVVGYINPAFVGDSGRDVTINMNNLSISVDERDDTAVVQYIVQEGDTLETIASEFGTTVSTLRKINAISSIKPGQKIIVTDEEDGIIYTVRETQNIKVFANKYGLNLSDLMTLNYITDDTEMLQKGQEIFINLTEEKANAIPGFIDKGQPDLSPQIVRPKPTVVAKPASSTSSSTTTSSSSSSSSSSTAKTLSKVQSRWTFTANITNGFARGYCTWYVATQMKHIFPYETATTQSRPFGGNANQWYKNAQKAGLSVGKTPKAGAIIVYSALRNAAGHVGIVKEYYPDRGEMLIEDMNYEGKFVVTRRIESTSRKEIIGYIYG